MYDERGELITTLRSIPVTLAALVRQLDDARASIRPTRVAWSISEVVCHLLDGEQRTYERVIRIRDEARPTLPLFPDDEYRGRSLAPVLASFRALRLEHARLLDDLEPYAWSRTGIHEAEGVLSILDIARHTAAHDVEHLAQIARASLRTPPDV
jgi:hypothetical protein